MALEDNSTFIRKQLSGCRKMFANIHVKWVTDVVATERESNALKSTSVKRLKNGSNTLYDGPARAKVIEERGETFFKPLI